MRKDMTTWMEEEIMFYDRISAGEDLVVNGFMDTWIEETRLVELLR